MPRMLAALGVAAMLALSQNANANPTSPATLRTSVCWFSPFCYAGDLTLYANGTFTDGAGTWGRWRYEPLTEQLRLVFPHDRILYRGVRQSGTCFEGSMQDRTGLSGTWSGCLLP